MSIMTRTSTTLAAAMLACSLVSTQAAALEGSWHAGISGGVSLLSPETEGSSFTLDEDQSSAVSAYLGVDITPMVSAEIAFTDLGEAELSQDQTIGYQAVSVGAVAYVLGEKRAIDRAEGASLYLRLGLSAIDNESDIELTESNNTALWVGAGIQYPLSRNWGLRAEASSFDGDAQALMAGLFWRMGPSSYRNAPAVIPAEAEVEASASADITTDSEPQQPVEVEPSADEPAIEEPTLPAVADITQDCPPEAVSSLPIPEDCALFNSAVAGLDFVGETTQITAEGTAVLDQVAATMNNYPELILELRVHTQSLGNPELEQQLSADRAKAVARYLVQNGVPVSQLRAKAFGATQPLSDDGRAADSRVEFKSVH